MKNAGATAQPVAVPVDPPVNCSAPNATIDFPTQCPTTPGAPAEPVKAPEFNAAFAPVRDITQILYGVGYGVLNIILIVALIILIKFFKRKASKPRSKANPGT